MTDTWEIPFYIAIVVVFYEAIMIGVLMSKMKYIITKGKKKNDKNNNRDNKPPV